MKRCGQCVVLALAGVWAAGVALPVKARAQAQTMQTQTTQTPAADQQQQNAPADTTATPKARAHHQKTATRRAVIKQHPATSTGQVNKPGTEGGTPGVVPDKPQS